MLYPLQFCYLRRNVDLIRSIIKPICLDPTRKPLHPLRQHLTRRQTESIKPAPAGQELYCRAECQLKGM
jgi:hypothetical protein